MAKNKIALDNEELELLEEIERRQWIDMPLSKEESESYAQNDTVKILL